jgi:hypothetical protein
MPARGAAFGLVCAILIIGHQMAEASRYPVGPTTCSADPECTAGVSTFIEPVPIMVYLLWFFTIAGCLVIFQPNPAYVEKYRMYAKEERRDSIAGFTGDDAAQDANPLLQDADAEAIDLDVEEEKPTMYMIGYKDTSFGNAVLGLVGITSVFWVRRLPHGLTRAPAAMLPCVLHFPPLAAAWLCCGRWRCTFCCVWTTIGTVNWKGWTISASKVCC